MCFGNYLNELDGCKYGFIKLKSYSTNENVVVPPNKLKSVSMILVGLVFVVAGVCLIILSYGDAYYNVSFLRLMGILLSSLFGMLFVSGLVGMYRKYALIIGKDELVDASIGPLSSGKVNWKNVQKVALVKSQLQEVIAIYIDNPKMYMRKGNFLRRMWAYSNMKSIGTPISIPVNALGMDKEDVVCIIKSRL